jgi:phosphohistidine phosphatase
VDRKSLYLLRHAKSSWDEPELADHDRPLAPRGRRATKLVAGHIRREGIEPALVLCSSARRARETLDGISPALGEDVDAAVDVQIEPELYGASAGELLERLRQIPDTVATAMLIGHNPGIQTLALSLAGSGEPLPKIERKYPTGALATLAFSGRWRDLEPGGGELTAFVGPKDLR